MWVRSGPTSVWLNSCVSPSAVLHTCNNSWCLPKSCQRAASKTRSTQLQHPQFYSAGMRNDKCSGGSLEHANCSTVCHEDLCWPVGQLTWNANALMRSCSPATMHVLPDSTSRHDNQFVTELYKLYTRDNVCNMLCKATCRVRQVCFAATQPTCPLHNCSSTPHVKCHSATHTCDNHKYTQRWHVDTRDRPPQPTTQLLSPATPVSPAVCRPGRFGAP